MNLDKAHDVGRGLHIAKLDSTTAEIVAWEIVRALYYKRRARRYRNLCCFAIMKGWYLRQSEIEAGVYRKFCFDKVNYYMDMPHIIP